MNEMLTSFTGDPFADTGGIVIKILQEDYPEKDTLSLIEFITDIYVNKWEGKLNAFFLNSKITQPAFDSKRKIEETVKYFKSLIDGTAPFKEGYCRITGENTKLFPAGRDNSLLSGSGNFLNFHHNFEEGLYLSKEALIRLFLLPFGSLLLGGKIAIIHSNSLEIIEFLVKEIVRENKNNLARNIDKGVLKSNFSNPTNALFNFAEKCIRSLDLYEETEVTLNLFHFTNFGAQPEIDIYSFPSNLFKFYSICLRDDYRTDWNKFSHSFFRSSKFKGAIYNQNTDTFEFQSKNNIEIVGHQDYQVWRNAIFEKLLAQQSILRNFLWWIKDNPLNLMIVKVYLKIIRNMEDKTILKIEELAEHIIQDEDKIKKNLTKIQGAKRSFELRYFLLSQIKEHYQNNPNNNKPLITLKEYVEVLFPDGVYWSEIRDLLLIAIFQKLHESNIVIDVPEEIEEIADVEQD